MSGNRISATVSPEDQATPLKAFQMAQGRYAQAGGCGAARCLASKKHAEGLEGENILVTLKLGVVLQ